MKKILLLVGTFCNISTASGMDGDDLMSVNARGGHGDAHPVRSPVVEQFQQVGQSPAAQQQPVVAHDETTQASAPVDIAQDAQAHDIALPLCVLSTYGQLEIVKQNWVAAKDVDISKHTRRRQCIDNAKNALQQAASIGYKDAGKVRALMEFDIACALLKGMEENQVQSAVAYQDVRNLLQNVGILAGAVPPVVRTEEMIDDMGGDAKQQDPDEKKFKKAIEGLQTGFELLMKRKQIVPSDAANAFRNAISLCPEIVSLIAHELMSKSDVQPVRREEVAKDSLVGNLEDHNAGVAAYSSPQVDGVTDENKKFLVNLVAKRHSKFDQKAPNFKVYHAVIDQVLKNAQIMSVIDSIGDNLERMMCNITGYGGDNIIHIHNATSNCESMIKSINSLSDDARKDETKLAIVNILLSTCNTLEHEPTDGKEMQALHTILSHCITMAVRLVGSVDDAKSKQALEADFTTVRAKFLERVAADRKKSVSADKILQGKVYSHLMRQVQEEPALMNIIEKIGIHIESIIANLAEYRAHSNINKQRSQGSFKEIVRKMLGIGDKGIAHKSAQDQKARQDELNTVKDRLKTIFSNVDKTPGYGGNLSRFNTIKNRFEDLVKNFPDLIEQVKGAPEEKDVQQTDVPDDVTVPKRRASKKTADAESHSQEKKRRKKAPDDQARTVVPPLPTFGGPRQLPSLKDFGIQMRTTPSVVPLNFPSFEPFGMQEMNLPPRVVDFGGTGRWPDSSRMEQGMPSEVAGFGGNTLPVFNVPQPGTQYPVSEPRSPLQMLSFGQMRTTPSVVPLNFPPFGSFGMQEMNLPVVVGFGGTGRWQDSSRMEQGGSSEVAGFGSNMLPGFNVPQPDTPHMPVVVQQKPRGEQPMLTRSPSSVSSASTSTIYSPRSDSEDSNGDATNPQRFGVVGGVVSDQFNQGGTNVNNIWATQPQLRSGNVTGSTISMKDAAAIRRLRERNVDINTIAYAYGLTTDAVKEILGQQKQH